MNISDAEKELARLKKRVFRLEENIAVQSAKKNHLQEQLEAANQELEELQKRAESGADIEAVQKMGEVKNRISEIDTEIQKCDRDLQETNITLDAMKIRYGDVAAEAARLAQEQGKASGGSGAESETQISRMQEVLNRMKSLAQEFAKSLATGTGGILKGIISLAEKAAKSLAGIAKKALSLAKTGLKKLGTSLAGVFKRNTSMNESFSGGIKALVRYGLGIETLFALFRKMRAAIAEGIKSLAGYSDEVNSSLSAMKGALTQLKNSLATAFAPILTTVAPIITKLINMCSAAADAIARLIAMLSGKSTYVRAIAVQEEYADSLKGTGGAADDAAKSLAGFDEITQLTAEDAGGGGGAGASAEDMFETVEIEPFAFKSWGEAFSAMLDSILNDGIPKLKAGLSKLAAWINEFSANLYEMFTFPGIKEKMMFLGRDIAFALNQFVLDIDWGTLGGSLGAGLNLALLGLVSFVYSFNWAALGASLAAMVNNAVAEIDWYSVGLFLFAKFKIAIETLAGFLLNLDMAELAKAASDIVMGFFDTMTETIAGIDWQQLGTQLATFLANVNWAGVADSCFRAIGAAFGAAISFLWGLIKDAWKKVVNWWHDTAYEDGEFTLQGLLDGIWEKCKSIGAWIKEHIFQPFIDGFKAAFDINSPSKVMAEIGGFIIDGLLDGLKNAWKNVASWATGVVEWFTGLFKGAEKSVASIKGAAVGVGTSSRSATPASAFSARLAAMPKISQADIPALAAGAVIPPNRKFMAVLGDQTNGNNLEAPESLIRQIVREEAGSMEIVALMRSLLDAVKAGHVIMVDKAVLGRTARDGINDITMKSGKFALMF